MVLPSSNTSYNINYSNMMMLKVLTVLFFPYRAQLAVHSVHLEFDKRMLST